MKRFFLSVIFLWLPWTTLNAQSASHLSPAPSTQDFKGIQTFLASDWMEGREAGARGGFMAADYIGSMMQLNGLIPYGDADRSDNQGSLHHQNRTWFQNFEVMRFQVEKSSLALIQGSPQGESEMLFTRGIDYEVAPVPFGSEGETQVVFAGYGIEAPGKKYNDYNLTNVRNQIVVIVDGFPGHADTTSPAWKKLGSAFGTEYADLSIKLRVAEKLGAVAVIVINPRDTVNPYHYSPVNQEVVTSAMNSPKPSDPEYEDQEHYLPGDTELIKIPCFRLGIDATRLLLNGTGIDLPGFEKKAAREMTTASGMMHDKKLRFSVTMKQEPLMVRNVLGMITGTDSSRYIIVGAHYDHLGIRKGVIYNGADDNASGVSGMLALSGVWANHPEKPSCNIIFVAWTAEEKGLLGSEYFSRHTMIIPDRLSLVINMDMISRSASDDTARRVISIGTLPFSEDLKNIARKSNSQLEHPFTLDLWDVTGHSGSDYGPFAARKIPVMTFFSGFHDDYHTPRDVASKADPEKMEKILKIVNDCLRENTEKPAVKSSEPHSAR